MNRRSHRSRTDMTEPPGSLPRPRKAEALFGEFFFSRSPTRQGRSSSCPHSCSSRLPTPPPAVSSKPPTLGRTFQNTPRSDVSVLLGHRSSLPNLRCSAHPANASNKPRRPGRFCPCRRRLHCSVRPRGPLLAPSGYFFRVSVTFANGDAFPDLSTLSIVHDHVSVARSYAKVV